MNSLDKVFNGPLRQLKSALERLDHNHGRIARRNTRARVRYFLRELEGQMEKEYPAIRKSTVLSSRLSLDAGAVTARFKKQMEKRGYVQVASLGFLRAMAEAKTPLVQAPVRSNLAGSTWAPAWALYGLLDAQKRVLNNPLLVHSIVLAKALRALKQDKSKQQAVLAVARLTGAYSPKPSP